MCESSGAQQRLPRRSNAMYSTTTFENFNFFFFLIFFFHFGFFVFKRKRIFSSFLRTSWISENALSVLYVTYTISFLLYFFLFLISYTMVLLVINGAAAAAAAAAARRKERTLVGVTLAWRLPRVII